MSDSDLDIKIVADQLGKDLENALPEIQAEIEQAVGNLSQATYAGIISKIQSMDMRPENRQDYLRGLKIEKIDQATWVIFLDNQRALELEEGLEPYSIKEKLLKSQKIVEVGTRSGQKWVRESKAGKKYAAVPFDHKPFSKEKFSGDLAKDIKRITAMNKHTGQEQRITKLFKDLDGNAVHGKVATAGKFDDNPNLSNLTKYQYVHSSGAVSSIYMTYRMVHEDSAGWQHPGTPGFQLFKEAEAYVEAELENIVKTLL